MKINPDIKTTMYQYFLYHFKERNTITYEADKEGLVIGSPLAIASPFGLDLVAAEVEGAIMEFEVVEFKRIKVPAGSKLVVVIVVR